MLMKKRAYYSDLIFSLLSGKSAKKTFYNFIFLLLFSYYPLVNP
jgi:hypothetical protein